VSTDLRLVEPGGGATNADLIAGQHVDRSATSPDAAHDADPATSPARASVAPTSSSGHHLGEAS